jgi:hypothetical protein
MSETTNTTNKQYLDLTGLTQYDGKIKGVISEGVKDAKDYADGLGTNYEAAGAVSAAVAALEAGSIKTNADNIATTDGKIGELSGLTTANKTNIISAINEVSAAVEAGGQGAVVSVTPGDSADGLVKVYTISQGTTEVGKINVPKDMVVSSGSVVTVTDDNKASYNNQAAGTYIRLELANSDTPIYVNVKDLVDEYTAATGDSASQIQVAINERAISATIQEKAVSKAHLDETVQATLNKADNAESVATSKANAAQAAAEATASADATKKANAAQAAAEATASADATKKANAAQAAAEATASADATTKASAAQTAAIAAAATDATTKADAAQTAAKAYTDTEIAKIAAITTSEIDALFTTTA